MVLTDSLRCPWCYTDWHGLPRGKCLGSHTTRSNAATVSVVSPSGHFTAWGNWWEWGNWWG